MVVIKNESGGRRSQDRQPARERIRNRNSEHGGRSVRCFSGLLVLAKPFEAWTKDKDLKESKYEPVWGQCRITHGD